MSQLDLDQNEPEWLDFSVYDVTDLASVAPYFVDLDNRCGIYILRFVNGSAYVGQTGDVVKRFSSHYRAWGKKLPDVAIEKVEFATCEAEHLNVAERAVISALEQTTTLHNKLLTNWPGGRGDIEIRHAEVTPFRIPADRRQRPRLPSGAKNGKLRRYWAYVAHPHTSELSRFIGAYLAEAVPSPEATAGTMWTCTALPTTGDQSRLVTLNVGGLETIYAVLLGESDDKAHTWIWMNVAIPEGRSLDELDISTSVCEAAVRKYRSESVWCWTFDLNSFLDPDDQRLDDVFEEHLSHQDELFDLAYALNRRLMARRPSMWIDSHNDYLAAEYLFFAMDFEMSATDSASVPGHS